MTKERELLSRAGLIIAQYRWSDPEDKGLQELSQEINEYFFEEQESKPVAFWDTQNGTLIPADIVDELVETLKAVVRYVGNGGDDYLGDQVRAALKKLEGSHE